MSSVGDYRNRMRPQGDTARTAAYLREKRMLERKMKTNLSWHDVVIDGVPRNVAMINSDNYNEKVMISQPGEDFDCGGLVEHSNNHWLIVEKDAANELYTRVKLTQCNYILKWMSKDGDIMEQWCVVNDGTKYLLGEYEDRYYATTRGDNRIQILISKNEYTEQFNRECRFIIDEPNSHEKLAYNLSKLLKVGNVYNGKGIYSFVLGEGQTTKYDNLELGIADYYKYFPYEEDESPSPIGTDDPPIINPEEGGWL